MMDPTMGVEGETSMGGGEMVNASNGPRSTRYQPGNAVEGPEMPKGGEI